MLGWNRLACIQKPDGGRNRDRTYDLCDVNAALVPTELCAPGSHPASVSAVDDTSGSGQSPETSGPGDGLGLLPCRVLSSLEVVGCHVDAEHAFAAVADQVERLRADDLAGNGLPVPAALACNDGSHLFSTPGPPIRTTELRASHHLRSTPVIPWLRDTVVAASLITVDRELELHAFRAPARARGGCSTPAIGPPRRRESGARRAPQPRVPRRSGQTRPLPGAGGSRRPR